MRNLLLTKDNRFSMVLMGLFVLVFAVVFFQTWQSLIHAWSSSDDYSHGFLIPFVTGFFIWQKREELKKVNMEYSRWGIVLIVVAMLIHLLGTVLYVFSISGFSILFLIFGFTLFLFGRQVTRIIVFPLLFFVFFFPVPDAFICAISFPFKMLVAKPGVDIVRILGIPAFREGFNITIPAGSLLVGNPCSGLRSLIAFMALGSVFAYMIDFSLTKKIALFLVSIPIAILSNIVRVPILILISHGWGLEAAAPDTIWHTASGVLVFVIGLGALYLAGRLLQRK